MKPTAVTLIIFSILLSGLIVLTSHGNATDVKPSIGAKTQIAESRAAQSKEVSTNEAPRQLIVDTIYSGCLGLTLGDNGAIGPQSDRYVSFDYPGSCERNIFAGSPFVSQVKGLDTLLHISYLDSQNLVVAVGQDPGFSTVDSGQFQMYRTPVLTTASHEIGLQITWWAPISADSCNFMIQELKTFCLDGSSHGGLMFGEVVDWDIGWPSTNYGVWVESPGGRFVGLKGSGVGHSECPAFAATGGAILLATKRSGQCVDTAVSATGYTGLSGNLNPRTVRRQMALGTIQPSYTPSDQQAVIGFGSEIALNPLDTISFYCALIIGNNSGYPTIPIDSSRGWFMHHVAPPCPCCFGLTGNVNMAGIVDLSDLSALVSYLTGGGYTLPCYDAANVNGAGIVDLSDLSSLVSYLTGGGYVLPSCP